MGACVGFNALYLMLVLHDLPLKTRESTEFSPGGTWKGLNLLILYFEMLQPESGGMACGSETELLFGGLLKASSANAHSAFHLDMEERRTALVAHGHFLKLNIFKIVPDGQPAQSNFVY